MKHILLAATAIALLPAVSFGQTTVPAIDSRDVVSTPLAKPVQTASATQADQDAGPVTLMRTPPAAASAPASGNGPTAADPVPTTPTAASATPPTLSTTVAQLPDSSPAVSAPAPFPAQDNPPSNGGVQYPNHPPPAIDPISHAPMPLTTKEGRGVAITRRWRNRNAMPATGADGAVTFEYGATQPSIVCAPLTVCLLKLQDGEHVLPDGLQLGDKARWHVTPTLAGSQTVLVIKPTDAALRTTMAVMTDRRVYSVRLVSVDSEARSMAISEFDYPDETRAQWQSYYQQVEQKRQDNTLPNGRNIANLDFGYRITGDNPAWRPERVYSDGIHTYIQFPDAMRSSDSPSLLALARDGSWFSNPTGQLVNYRREGNTYLVDRVIDRAELVVGVGDGQTRVVISHVGG